MTGENKTNNFFETAGYVLFYVLSFPFILLFGVIFGVCGVVFLAVYSIFALIAWPFIEIHNAIKERREKKKNVVVTTVPEKIEASVGTIEVNDNENA